MMLCVTVAGTRTSCVTIQAARPLTSSAIALAGDPNSAIQFWRFGRLHLPVE
jgi:hypothetical protein